MERYHSPDIGDLFADSLRITAHALQFSAEEVIRQINEKRTASTDADPFYQSTPHLIGTLMQDSLNDSLDDEEYIDSDEIQLFFVAAIEDIGHIIKVIAAQYPYLNDGAILEVMSQPETMHTIARLALQPSENMLQYIFKNLEENGSLLPDKSYIINDDTLRIDSIGCPTAGYIATPTYEGAVKPLPIFKQFIPWATKVQLLSEEWHSFRAETTPQ